MKKIVIFVCLSFIFAFSLLCCGCNSMLDLTPYISELRQNVYYGESKSYKIDAFYGFRETPFMADGIINYKNYALCFVLGDILTDNAEYSVSFNYDGTEYSSCFNLSPPRNKMIAVIPIENFNEKSFSITITKGDKKEDITMSSTITDGTISYQEALNSLIKNQKSLVDKYCDKDGNFNGEIHIRLVVNKGKSYWYIGLTNSPHNLKALLVDGSNGDILAIREMN